MAKKLDFSNKNFNFTDDDDVKNIEIKEGSVVQIPLSQIELGENIRDVFTDDESQLIQLGESIKEYGQLEPCIVYKENDKYILKLGSRRFKACQLVGIDTLDCIVSKNFKDEIERIVIQAIENEHRKDMSSREREVYIARLTEMGMKAEEIARRLHKNKGWVSEALQAHDFVEKNSDIINNIKEEPSTRTMWQAGKLSPQALTAAIEKTKEEGNTKKAFKKNIQEEFDKQKESETQEKVIKNQGETQSENNDDDFSMSFDVEDDTNEVKAEEKVKNYEEVKNYDLHFSLTENTSKKNIKLSILNNENQDLNNFIKTQIENYYLEKGYLID